MSPKNLHQRITFYILIPLFLLLAAMGGTGFLYARKALLDQWSEIASGKLQKSAHHIDMRLSRPKELLLMLKDNSSSNQDHKTHQFIIEQLREMDGVLQVEVDWPDLIDEQLSIQGRMRGRGITRMRYSKMAKLQVSLPQYNTVTNNETVTVSTDFRDQSDRKVGQIKVVISFHDLIDQIIKAPWWKSNKAFLVDYEGNILSSTLLSEDQHLHKSNRKFAESDSLERETLAAIQKNQSGTVFGPGHPPKEISGYYHLNEAPWSLVIIAPGKQVLSSILQFRSYYFLSGFVFILAVVIFIRVAINPTAKAIKNVSAAAQELANGNFNTHLPVVSNDEVGELTQNFNKMTQHLEERLRLKEAMDLAMEVQQNLLPPQNLSIDNLEIHGLTLYCDETGGDYFDIIEFPGEKNRVCVVVGDVVGHGVGAALLMTTVRALLRSRIMQPGSLAHVVRDVNQMLFLDTSQTGSFVTLFVMLIDTSEAEITWVRAGHEPATLCDPDEKKLSELKGDGLVLGIDRDWDYIENVLTIPRGSLILIDTDGASDIENEAGETFGKERVKSALTVDGLQSPEHIINKITTDIDSFRGAAHQNDDITLVAVRLT